MKRSLAAITYALFLCAACDAASFAQGTLGKDTKPEPVLMKPDLTITNTIWRNKPSTVIVVVANVGKVKAQNFIVGFGCQTKPDAKGYSLGYGSSYFIQELLPNQTRRITLDCKGATVKGATVDSDNTVNESNESNNKVIF